MNEDGVKCGSLYLCAHRKIWDSKSNLNQDSFKIKKHEVKLIRNS